MTPSSRELGDAIRRELPESSIEIVRDENRERRYFVILNIKIDYDGKQVPSNYAINKAIQTISGGDLDLVVILQDETARNIEATVRGVLLGKYTEYFRNAFVTISDMHLIVWTDNRARVEARELKFIEHEIKQIAEIFGFEFSQLHGVEALNTPSMTVCNEIIRAMALIDFDTLLSQLERRGFQIENHAWLRHLLDRSRRGGNIIRLSNEKYVMTLQGLKALGSRKSRSSPDITRALELARLRG